MFERFTDRARRVLVLAQEEARLLNHSFIGTEHILLGLVHEGDGVAAQALEALGISLQAVREQVEETIGPANSAPTGSPPFTPRAKKVLELSLREALQLGHNYIGTEHLLLGIVREGEGVAAQVLQGLGTDLPRVRQEVISLLGAGGADDARNAAVAAVARQSRGTLADRPRHPIRVLPGPLPRLGAHGIEFRVVGVLFFDGAIEVMWRLSGIPAPLVELMRGPLLNPTFEIPPPLRIRPGSAPPRARVVAASQLVGGELPNSYVTLSDPLETPYLASRSIFEIQLDGECAGSSLFTPAVPDEAPLLRISWQGETLDMEL